MQYIYNNKNIKYYYYKSGFLKYYFTIINNK